MNSDSHMESMLPEPIPGKELDSQEKISHISVYGNDKENLVESGGHLEGVSLEF